MEKERRLKYFNEHPNRKMISTIVQIIMESSSELGTVDVTDLSVECCTGIIVAIKDELKEKGLLEAVYEAHAKQYVNGIHVKHLKGVSNG